MPTEEYTFTPIEEGEEIEVKDETNTEDPVEDPGEEVLEEQNSEEHEETNPEDQEVVEGEEGSEEEGEVEEKIEAGAVVEAAKADDDIEERSFNIDEEIKKVSNGDYGSYEEMVNTIKELKDAPKEQLADPLIKDLNKVLLNNPETNVTQWLKVQTTDYDTMDELELIREKMIFEDPDITQKELDHALGRYDYLYNNSEEELEELVEEGKVTRRELEALDAEVTRKSREAKKFFKGHKEKLKIDLNKDLPGKVDEKELQKQVEERNQSLLKELNTAASSYKEEEIKILDGKTEFKYIVRDEDKKDITDEISEIIKNPNHIYSRWTDSSGVVNWPKLMSDLHLLNKREDMFKAATQQSKTKGQEAVVKDIKNVGQKKRAGQSEGKPPSVDKQIADQYKEAHGIG